MADTELQIHLPVASKKILIEVMDWAEKNNTASFYLAQTMAGFGVILPTCPDEKRYDQNTIIDEWATYDLIENSSGDRYVFTQLAHRWREYERKGPVGKFFLRAFTAWRKFLSTVWGIVVGIGVILGIILAILQIMGIR